MELREAIGLGKKRQKHVWIRRGGSPKPSCAVKKGESGWKGRENCESEPPSQRPPATAESQSEVRVFMIERWWRGEEMMWIRWLGLIRWHGMWNDLIKSNLTVNPVKIDGNAMYGPNCTWTVLVLRPQIHFYVGCTLANSSVLDLTLYPSINKTALSLLRRILFKQAY